MAENSPPARNPFHLLSFLVVVVIGIGVCVAGIGLKRTPVSLLYSIARGENEPVVGQSRVPESKVLLEIPVVQVFLQGCPSYLRIQLWQATRMNRRVILLGTTRCKSAVEAFGIEFYDAANYSSSAVEFKEKYFPDRTPGGDRWVNGRREIELVCFQRWFVLQEFMRALRLPLVFYSDGDTMLYANVTEIYHQLYAGENITAMWVKPRISITFVFFSLDGVEDFIGFIRQMFVQYRDLPLRDESTVHMIYNDMFAMSLYATRSVEPRSARCFFYYPDLPPGHPRCLSQIPFDLSNKMMYTPKFRVASMADVTEQGLFDNHLGYDAAGIFNWFNNTGDSIVTKMHPITKQVSWVRGQPFFNMVLSPASVHQTVQVRALGLHFQGRMKGWMRGYMRDLRDHPDCLRPPCTCTSAPCLECLPACDQSATAAFD